jgi:RNA polymerase sigma factor (sigma-70 family)
MDTFPDPGRLLETLRRVCANRDWRLLEKAELGVTEAELVRQMAAELRRRQATEGPAEITETQVERAAVYVYCGLLHRAIGMERSLSQERAFAELWRYVTPIIGQVLQDEQEAAACANETLLRVWQKRNSVQDPGHLLSYAATIAGHAAFRAYRRQTGHDLIFVGLFDADDEDGAEGAALDLSSLPAAASSFQQVEDADQIATLARLICACLPRMRAGAEVIIRLLLLGQSVADVAAALGRRPLNIHTIKCRALQKLRQCRTLLAALDEMPALASHGGSQ